MSFVDIFGTRIVNSIKNPPLRTWLLFMLMFCSVLQAFSQADSARARHTATVRQPAHKVTADSLQVADSLRRAADSLKAAALPRVNPYDTILQRLARTNPLLQTEGKTTVYDINPMRPNTDQDWLAYLVGGVLLLLGVIRTSYLKYFSDLFRAFFNPTLSQRQLKDQLSQSPFPNFLLNFFFAISMGLYLYLLMYRLNYPTNAIAWMLIPGLMVLVGVIYLVKFVVLRFCGWLFGNEELIDAYVFVLYLINKVLGIMLAPFLVVLAFCEPQIAAACLYISIFFIVLLVVYRYIRSYSLIRQYLSFSKLHFFLYLCAFEVVPVLIITKVLLLWLTGNP